MQAVDAAARHYVHMLVVHRLRSHSDRAAAAVAFHEAWGAPLSPLPRPSVSITSAVARLGRASLPRAALLDCSGESGRCTSETQLCFCRNTRSDSSATDLPGMVQPGVSGAPFCCGGAGDIAAGKLMLLPGQMIALEVLAECMARGWPALLIGASGSGKASIARSAAALAGIVPVTRPSTHLLLDVIYAC